MRFRSASLATIERLRQYRCSVIDGVSHGSSLELVATLFAGERDNGTVVGCGASFACVGGVRRSVFAAGLTGCSLVTGRCPTRLVGVGDPSDTRGVDPSVLVLTVVRLLSLDAAAVFLFASARSWSSIVS